MERAGMMTLEIMHATALWDIREVIVKWVRIKKKISQ